MATETLSYEYTSEAEIRRLYGKTGLQNILRDVSGTDLEAIWDEIIADATQTIDQYAAQIYNQEDLATSRWVRIRATWIASFRLSQRTANNDLFAQRYEEIIEELQKVLSLQLMIPNIPLSADMSPMMSNPTIDPRSNSKKIRVQQEISTGGTSDRQDVAWMPWMTDFY
jgi:phage gp36-like protein